MEMQALSQTSAQEQAVIRIIRKLPAERIMQLVDFARFLEFETTKRHDAWLDEDEGSLGTEEDIRAGEEKWDSLFAQPEAKRMMREMAREALDDYRTGRTTEISFTDDGRLAPE